MNELKRVQQACRSKWRWMVACWKIRESVELVTIDAEDSPRLRERVHLLELDLTHAQERIKELEKKNGEHRDALAHVGQFIAASHRITIRPKPGTINQLLANAQRR